MPAQATVHIPILVAPIIKALMEPLQGCPAGYLVDCTLGGGGHTRALLDALAGDSAEARHRVLSIDQDEDAIARARKTFAKELDAGRLELGHSRFGEADRLFDGKEILGLMADLGFSSDQLEDPERGLSFQADGPLDMRLDRSRGRTALDYLHQVSERELEAAFREYGEERFSRRIAGALIERRKAGELPRTTRELAELVVRAVPPPARHGRIHAATRVFQALRIVVNDELKELDSLLGRVILNVRQGGRVAILSFHSLEDRRVKQAFRSTPGLAPLTKKPIEADEAEISRNARSRSAKLRIAERIGGEQALTPGGNG